MNWMTVHCKSAFVSCTWRCMTHTHKMHTHTNRNNKFFLVNTWWTLMSEGTFTLTLLDSVSLLVLVWMYLDSVHTKMMHFIIRVTGMLQYYHLRVTHHYLTMLLHWCWKLQFEVSDLLVVGAYIAHSCGTRLVLTKQCITRSKGQVTVDTLRMKYLDTDGRALISNQLQSTVHSKLCTFNVQWLCL